MVEAEVAVKDPWPTDAEADLEVFDVEEIPVVNTTLLRVRLSDPVTGSVSKVVESVPEVRENEYSSERQVALDVSLEGITEDEDPMVPIDEADDGAELALVSESVFRVVESVPGVKANSYGVAWQAESVVSVSFEETDGAAEIELLLVPVPVSMVVESFPEVNEKV